MITPTLEPSGAKMLANGRTRYAIWHWRDADGLALIPCAAIAALATAKGGGQTCGDRAIATLRGKTASSLHRVMMSHGLLDQSCVLTEKGAVIAFAFKRRKGVRETWETAHGYGVPW